MAEHTSILLCLRLPNVFLLHPPTQLITTFNLMISEWPHMFMYTLKMFCIAFVMPLE